MNTFTKCVFSTTITAIMLFSTVFHLPITVQAKEQSIELSRTTYEFDEKSVYDVDAATPSLSTDASFTLGTLTLKGDINSISKKGTFDAYEISDKSLISLEFQYNSALRDAVETEWHLRDDGKKEVAGSKLDSKIKKGAIILQTSLDGEKWTKAAGETDLSENIVFDANNGINDAQLINGCYYRVITAFAISKKSPGQFNIFDVFNSSASYTEKLKCAEVYSFYAEYPVVDGTHYKNEHIYNTNEYTSRTKKNDYLGNEPSDKNDPHKGWNLGKFVLSGYTNYKDGNIYQKTLGDRIKLIFKLEQDITQLNGKNNLTIANDKNGYDGDSKLNQSPHAMGHGELIIWHKMPNGDTKTAVYANFLEALASPSANTSIILYEEGDYEVHLDYAVTNSKGTKKTCYYRTSFSFSIENGNVMGFLFDAQNGNELFDTDRTENGFRIDNANSQRLDILVTKQVLHKNADGWSLDRRFQKSVSDGDSFTDEGKYEITWSSKSDSGNKNTKILYVGDSETISKYRNYDSYGTIEIPATTEAPKTQTTPATTRRTTSSTTTKSTTSAREQSTTASSTTSRATTKTTTTKSTTTKAPTRPQPQTTTKP